MKKYSDEEKEMWVEDWKGSGKSLWAYAKASGLNPQTFRKWTEGREKAAGFVELSAFRQEKPELVPEILIEKGDIKIHIPVAINRNDLRAVIQSLGCEL
jgi:transposase-like protein